MEKGFERFQITIEDDFDLARIGDSGQCFRVRRFPDDTYRFVTKDEAIYLRKLSEGRYSVSCGRGAWDSVWKRYFDLARNYREIREKAGNRNLFVDRAMESGAGIRVLRQDPWEMLVTFIISQRKSIPAISGAVEKLAVRYGRKIETEYETLYGFPAAEALEAAGAEELNACGLGYRTAYVRDAAEKVAGGELDLEAIGAYGDDSLYEELLKVHGVGKKVANCVCLFGYGRIARVPVDVWISRAIREECRGEDPFGSFGEEAGIIQQYIFYYERLGKKAVKKTDMDPGAGRGYRYVSD